MDPTAILEAVTSLILAVAALTGLGGAGYYMVKRRSNGQPVLPSSAHDETVGALNGIKDEVASLHTTVKESNGASQKAHKEILDVVAPRVPRHG